MRRTSSSAAKLVIATTVLLIGAYSIVLWYLTSDDWDLPLSLAVRIARPWALLSIFATGAAMALRSRGYRRLGMAVAICAVASPVAVVVDFFTSFSDPFAG